MHYSNFSKKIVFWYKNTKIEKFPWQLNATIYTIWLSEIMLQQTQAKTVIPYYNKFIKKFPTIEKLALATLDEILYLWSGLGYYARARNLHKTTAIILQQYHGKFPTDFKTIVSFPGIGKSTAGAILSLALNQRYPILDGNVKRILTRYYHTELSLLKKPSQINKKLWIIIEKLLPHTEIATFNQAIMNFGQLICIRSNPICNICPIRNNCQKLLNQNNLLVSNQKKIKKFPITKIIWVILLLNNNKTVWLEQRTKKKIWKKLFCFPEFSDFEKLKIWLSDHKIDHKYKKLNTFQHILSNINLHIHPLLFNIKKKINLSQPNGIWYDFDEPPIIGIPKPVSSLLKNINQHQCTNKIS